MLRRALVLWIVCAHWAAAALPCAPLLEALPQAPAATAEAVPHAHGHGHGHAQTDAPRDLAWTAPCACGCEADPAGGGPSARVGAALLPDPVESLAAPPPVRAAPVDVAWPPAPEPSRDRVPI